MHFYINSQLRVNYSHNKIKLCANTLQVDKLNRSEFKVIF